MADRRKPVYQNELPPLPADCILPKFEIPRLSPEFSLEAEIHKLSTDSFVTDTFLGVPVEFADLAIYSIPAKNEDIREEDLRYVPDLVPTTSRLTVPAAQPFTRAPVEAPVKVKQRDPSKLYRRSPFFSSRSDPEMEEQLKAAFANYPGGVPRGEICLVRRAEPLMPIMLKSAETITAVDEASVQVGRDTEVTVAPESKRVLLMSRDTRFLKAVPTPWDGAPEVVSATRAYQVTVEPVKGRGYYVWAEDGMACELGKVDAKYALKALSFKEQKEEQMTATPVRFVDHDAAEDQGFQDDE
jgi:hypothetical protein